MQISSSFGLYMSCKVEQQNNQQKSYKEIEKGKHKPSIMYLLYH